MQNDVEIYIIANSKTLIFSILFWKHEAELTQKKKIKIKRIKHNFKNKKFRACLFCKNSNEIHKK